MLQNPKWPKSNEISQKKITKDIKPNQFTSHCHTQGKPNSNLGHLREAMYRQPSLLDNRNNQQKIIKIEEVQLWIFYLYYKIGSY